MNSHAEMDYFEPSYVYSPKIPRMEYTIIKPRDCRRCSSVLHKSILRQKIWFCSCCGLYDDDPIYTDKVNFQIPVVEFRTTSDWIPTYTLDGAIL